MFQPLEIMQSQQNIADECELFVGDLSYFCSEQNLQELFSTYGTVLSNRIRRSEVGGHSLMHGFVRMSSPEEAKQVVTSCHQLLFMGRKLRVQICTSQTVANQFRLVTSADTSGVQIHTSFISRTNIGTVVDESYLRDMFSPYGEVVDVVICRHNLCQNPVKQTGYGFIKMARQQDADAAMKDYTTVDRDNIRFDCLFSHRSSHSTKGSRQPSRSTNNSVRNRYAQIQMLHQQTSRQSYNRSQHSQNNNNDKNNGNMNASPLGAVYGHPMNLIEMGQSSSRTAFESAGLSSATTTPKQGQTVVPQLSSSTSPSASYASSSSASASPVPSPLMYARMLDSHSMGNLNHNGNASGMYSPSGYQQVMVIPYNYPYMQQMTNMPVQSMNGLNMNPMSNVNVVSLNSSSTDSIHYAQPSTNDSFYPPNNGTNGHGVFMNLISHVQQQPSSATASNDIQAYSRSPNVAVRYLVPHSPKLSNRGFTPPPPPPTN